MYLIYPLYPSERVSSRIYGFQQYASGPWGMHWFFCCYLCVLHPNTNTHIWPLSRRIFLCPWEALALVSFLNYLTRWKVGTIHRSDWYLYFMRFFLADAFFKILFVPPLSKGAKRTPPPPLFGPHYFALPLGLTRGFVSKEPTCLRDPPLFGPHFFSPRRR